MAPGASSCSPSSMRERPPLLSSSSPGSTLRSGSLPRSRSRLAGRPSSPCRSLRPGSTRPPSRCWGSAGLLIRPGQSSTHGAGRTRCPWSSATTNYSTRSRSQPSPVSTSRSRSSSSTPAKRGDDRRPGRPSLSSLALPLLRLGTDLLEQGHRVEVVPTCLDLRTLEHVEDGGGCLLVLARGRDRSCCGCKRAGVRALPGHFQDRGIAAGHGGRDRADRIRERRLPALEQFDDLLGAFDRALGPKLVVARVGGEQFARLLPGAVVEGVDLLAGDLDQLVGGQRFGLHYGHSLAPSVRSDARTGSTRRGISL